VLIFTCYKNLFTKLTLIIMQDYKTEHPFDIAMSEEQQMTWDMLRKFAETEMRPIARDAEAAGRA
jgi:hypothetical protein